MIQVKGSELTRVLVNADLWLDDEIGPGIVSFEEKGIRVYGTDGFVAMTDFVSYEGIEEDDVIPDVSFAVNEKTVELLLLASRKAAHKLLELVPSEDEFKVPYSFTEDEDTKKWVIGEGSTGLGIPEEIPPWGNVFEEDLPIEAVSFAAARAERFLKLSRVRADSIAPIDMKFVQPWNKNAPAMALVRIGSTFRAAINLVNRDVALQNIDEEKRGYFWE